MEKVLKKGKNLIIFLFFSFILLLSSLILISCGETVPVESISFNQSSIELFKGQGTFLNLVIKPDNANNYNLEWSSSDNTVATINSRGRVESVDYGTAVISCNVVGTELTATCTVSVTDGQIIDMYVDENSVIKNYYTGETFDSTGMIVWVQYENNVERQLSEGEYQIIVPSSLKPNDELIVVYGDYEPVHIQLNVIDDYVTEVEVVSEPIKTEYYIGETFDPTGLELQLIYASGKIESINNYTYSEEPFSYNDNSIKINYQDYTLDIPLTIKAKHTVSIYSNLQSVINSASKGDSIMLTGTHFNVESVTIPKSKNLTIYGIITQDSYTSITPNNNNPAFIIIDDVQDDENYQTTIANINIVSRETNESPLIVFNGEGNSNLNNFTLTLDNISFNYKNIAINGEKSETFANNFENITLNIINCEFISTVSTQSAIYFNGLSNSEINITSSNIDGYNGVTTENCDNVDINILDSTINVDEISLNLINYLNSNILINQSSYLSGFKTIYLNGEFNTFTIENSYLTALQNKEDITENSSSIINLQDAVSNTVQVNSSYLTTSYTEEYINATLYVVCIEDGEQLKSSNNQVTLSTCLFNFTGDEKFKINETSQTSTVTENTETKI